MVFGEEHSSQPVVTIMGAALQPDVTARLVSAYVDDSVHAPSMAVLRFSDERLDVLDDVRADIGKELRISVQQSGQGAPVEIFNGDITALEQEIDEDGAITTVRALDVRYKLQSGAAVTAFTQMSISDVVREVISGVGLTAHVGSFAGTLNHLARDGESAWDFLCRLARGVGAAIWVEGRTVHFDKPATASSAPSSTDPRTNPLVIARGYNLLSLRATLTGSGQVSKVEARGWDYRTKEEITEPGSVETTAAALAKKPTDLATALQAKPHLVRATGLGTQRETAAVATVAAATRAGGFAEIDGVARGNPRLRAGTAVHLADVGPQFTGKYVLTTARHEFDPTRGYLTTFTASDVSDRSVYGVLAGGTSTPVGGAERHVASAVVTSVVDPDDLGRVKLKFPFGNSYESWWARPVQLGAGRDRGISWLPEVDDEVLVAFGRSLDEPYVLGGLYNGQDRAAKGWPAHVDQQKGQVKRRALTSRNGMVIELVEDEQNDTLTLSTNNGAQHLTFTQTGQKGIVLVSQGELSVTAEKDVTVTGKQNITVSTSTGDVAIKGNNVSLEATTKLALKGVQLIAEGTGTATVKSPTLKVEGTGTAELTSTGVTTVRGSLVKIN